MIDLLRFTHFKLLSLLVALLAWLWHGPRVGKGAWLISILFIVELGMEVWASELALHQHHNHWLYNLYFPIEISLITAFAHYQWKDRRYTAGIVFSLPRLRAMALILQVCSSVSNLLNAFSSVSAYATAP